MIKKIKKPVSILLSLIMVFSLFTIVPFSASAAVGDVLSESEYLTFTAVEAGSSVTLKYANGTLKYNINNSGWQSYTAGTQITLADVGDYVRFSGKDTTFDYSNHFSLTGKVACSGNVMSLRLDDNGRDQGLTDRCFQYMFYNCIGLTTAPELPETTLADRCYYGMFQGCENLTKAPDLPATALANNCYGYMFSGCKSLTELPELPATNLAYGCYSYMFSGCTSLTKAPELPATELVDFCYYRMFYGCTSLTKAPELPSTNLANSCYSYMFSGCTSLTKAPELPATNLAESCYSNMFNGCTSLTELPALPATTLARYCYYYMFNGCSKICISDEAGTFGDITYSAEYRIPTTGEGSSAYDALYNMFRNTGGKFTGTPDINTTYYVPAPAPTTYTITDASVNGTVTASVNGTNVTEAEENADVTLTVAPAEGYQFVSISAGDVSLTTVTEGSQYSFTMPTKDVTVTAVFEEIPAPELPDVIKDCTYYDSYCGFYANVPFAGMFSDIQNGAIICDSYSETDKSIMDTKDYSYKFYDENGTELQAENIYHDDSADGYGFRVIMNVFRFSNPISGPLYIVATAPAPTYTITWKNYDDSDIGTSTVAEGETPTFSDTIGEIKEKPDNALYTYTFSGWTPDVVAATADATYTATFDAVPFVASVTADGTTTGYTSFSNAVSAWNNAANGSTLTLLDNVAISNRITINGTKILDLNDHRISMTGTDAIFYIGSGANLTLEDNATEKSTHYYSAAKNGSPGSVSDTADENHPYSFTGGYITGGKGYRTGNWRKGGVAYIAGGTFTINGGTLVGNQASGSGVSGGVEGGTIYATSGSFTLNGGNILADFSSNGAGGVFLEGTATFRMNGGSIKHCYAGYGAVIRNNNSADGAVILSGGTIAENISSHGKIIASGSMTVENVSIINNKGSVRSVIYVSGSPVIKDNTTSATDNTPRNVEVPNGKMINITGELTDGAEICVTMDTPGVFTETIDTALNDADKFFSDNSAYGVLKNTDGQLELKNVYTVTWKNWNNDVLETDENVFKDTTPSYDGEAPTKAEDETNTYTFTGWKNGEITYAPNELPAVTGDATYTATFTAVPFVASVTVGGTTTKYTDLSTALTNWTDGSTLTLLADVSIGSAINVTSGTKTLGLNGKTITMTGNDCILYVNGGSLTVNGNGGTLTGGKGGTQHYGDSYRRGGAIDLKSGSIILDNCNITNNTATFGGAVFMAGSTTLTIQNGTAFTNNSGGAVFWVQGGTVNMTGGTISNNSTTAVSLQGASWYSDLSRFNMTGGTISNNTGSGVAFSGTPMGICSVSGNAVIKDNTSSNLNLSGGGLLNVNGALGDDASIGITMSNPGVFTNSTDTSLNDPTKFFSDNSSYAVHKNDAGQLYLSKKLIVGHSLSLDGNIAINFYLDPAAAGLTVNDVTADNLSYSFAWKNQAETKAKVDVAKQAEQQAFRVSDDGNYIIVTCKVCAAEMSCDVNVSFTLGDKTETEVYSVRKYGDSVLNPTAEWLTKYKAQYPDGTAKSYANLVALVKAMLDYGAKAQTVFGVNFGVNTGDPANSILTGANAYTMDENVDSAKIDEAINEANDELASDMTELFGENFKTPSLVFLDESALKLYFEKKDPAFDTTGLTPWNNYFVIQKRNIPAKELDTLQNFRVNNKDIKYSALDYAKVLLATDNADYQSLAKAMYWYNQAANVYFD